MHHVALRQIRRGLATSANPIDSGVKCKRLEGKVALVTGSSLGIGYGIAERFAQEGAKVVICSRRQENVDRAVEKLSGDGHEVTGLICHVGVSDDRKKLLNEAVSKYGRLDCLVANVAVNPYVGPMMDCPESTWDKIFDVNVKSTFMLMKESLPLLRQAQSPSIIILSSVVGYNYIDDAYWNMVRRVRRPFCETIKEAVQDLRKGKDLTDKPVIEILDLNCMRTETEVKDAIKREINYAADPKAIGPYAVSKASLFGLCKYAAHELASEGIRVNCIAPGGIDTRFLKPFYRTQEVFRESMKLLPINRLGTSKEVAAAAAFLASDDASFVIGETIVVSGGIHSRL